MNSLAIQHRPTDEELVAAMDAAKDAGFSSTQIKHTDSGASRTRHHLGSRWSGLHLDEIRTMCEALSKAGKEKRRERKRKNNKKKSDRDKITLGLKRLLKAYPRSETHTQDYFDIHNSEEFRTIRRDLMAKRDYRCEACTRQFKAQDLDCHILDYERWRDDRYTMLLCREDCHPILDALRRRGKEAEANTTTQDDLPPLWRHQVELVKKSKSEATMSLFEDVVGPQRRNAPEPTMNEKAKAFIAKVTEEAGVIAKGKE